MSQGNFAAIKAYIENGDGVNLEKAFKVERQRLLEQGADEGFDKFKESKIPELKTEADHGAFIQGCLDALNTFTGGAQIQVIFEYQLYSKYGIQPSIALTSRTAKDEEFDPFLATPEEAQFRAQLLESASNKGLLGATESVKLQAEAASFEDAFKVLTPIEVKFSGEWDTGMTGHVAAHPDETEKDKKGQVLVYIDN